MALLYRLVLILGVLAVGGGLMALSLGLPWFGVLMLIGLALKLVQRPRPEPTSHGTATLSDVADLLRNGMLRDDGLIVGTTGYAEPLGVGHAAKLLFSPFSLSKLACSLFTSSVVGFRARCTIRIQNFVHLAAFAPTGKGKGVSLIIPNLLNWKGSCVTTDVKGENFLITSEHRHKVHRQRIVRLDPYRVCGPGGDSLNPLDFIDDLALDFIDLCFHLADSLVTRKGTEPDPHWNESAVIMLATFIAFVCACEKNRCKRNLQTVVILVSSPGAYLEAIQTMRQVKTHDGLISRLGHRLTRYVDRELGSVLTSIYRHISFLDSPAVQAMTVESTFDPRELRSGRMSVYLVLPPEYLASMPGIMRMWLSCLMRTLTRLGPDERNPVLFVVDECAHLGAVQVLEDAVTLVRGYGIRLWLFFQSSDQLKKCYGERAPTILDNIGTQIYFGTAAYESAEAISKRVGDFTMWVTSINKTIQRSHPTGGDGKQAGSHSTSTAITQSLHGRAIVRPDEVLRLPSDLALIFSDNLPVIPVKLLRYFDSPLFVRKPLVRRLATAALLALAVLGGGLGIYSGVFLAWPSKPTPDPDGESRPDELSGDRFRLPPGREVPPPRNGRGQRYRHYYP